MPVSNEGWPADAGPQDDVETSGLGGVQESEPDPVEDLDQPAANEATDPEEIPEFDPKVREDFEGLLYLGRLEHTFTWAGHEFRIRTLNDGELLEVGLLAKPWRGTMSEMKAYQTALVAGCVVTVDGQPMPVPLTSDPRDTAMANRFRYVQRSWFPPTFDAVYEEYLLLETRVSKALEAMGKV